MIGKLCAGPTGGASSGSLVTYLVGYAVAEKGASREDIQDALGRVQSEAEERPDLGVGSVWRPAAGQGTRPSSILVRNCASFATASLEMDADAAQNLGVRHSAMHFVWSFQTGESGKLTDEQVHTYVGEVLGQLGLDEHRSVAVVHRDTIVYDRNEDDSYARDGRGDKIVMDGNLHVHVAVGSVHPETGLAYNKTGLYKQMARVERVVENNHDLASDRGLYVTHDRGLSTERVEEASPAELRAWRAERKEERLIQAERKSFDGYRERDKDFGRYCDATVAHRLRQAIDIAQGRGREARWADLHAVAARFGVAIQLEASGKIILRDVGIFELKMEHAQELRDVRKVLKAETLDKDEIDQAIAEKKAEHAKIELAERDRKLTKGKTVELDSVLEDRTSLGDFLDVDESELDISRKIEAKPKMVLDEITAQSSTFARDDIDAWLASRISDPLDIERLSDLVMADESIRALEIDTRYPLMTTTDILAVEDHLAEDAKVLAGRESGITEAQIEHAIATYEAEQGDKIGKPFSLSPEQRNALQGLAKGSLGSVEGLPGTGKTTIMGVVRVLGEQTNREVVGLTLSQAAAERLESEAGFRTINTARAAILEDAGKSVMPRGGIVVVDEAGMMDSRANGRILTLARERGCIVYEIYDTRQLQPIDYGASVRIIRAVATDAGTHSELRDIQRQKRAWHKDAVALMADAILEKDETKRLTLVQNSLQILDDNGAITWVKDRDAAIDTAVTKKRDAEAHGYDVIMPAADKDMVRHLSEEDRRRAGLEGQGRIYRTNDGEKEFACGDRLMFLENSQGKKGIGVLNGDRATVVRTTQNAIHVRLDNASLVTIQTRAYKAFTHANAITHHKSQGASVGASVPVIDKSASAELVFLAMSRSKYHLDLIVPQSSFRDQDELAKHIAGRISLKTTSRTYDEILDRTGGQETLRVINMAKQELAEPVRHIYHAEIVEPAKYIREKKLRDLRAAHKVKREAISGSIAECAEKEKDLNRSFRSDMQAVFKATRPQGFGEWLQRNEEAHGTARDIENQRVARTTSTNTKTSDVKTQPNVTTPAKERQQTMNAPINQQQTQAQREAKLKAQQAAKRKPVAMTPFMPQFSRGTGIGARSGGSSPSIPLTPGDEHRHAMANMHGTAGKTAQALHLSQMQKNWKTPTKATPAQQQAKPAQMPQAKPGQSPQAKPAQVPQARLTPGQPASDAQIKAAREAYLRHQSETMTRVDGVWRDKPKQAQSQATPQAKPAQTQQPKTRREPPVKLNGKPVAAQRANAALDKIKATGERSVAVSASPTQKPGVFAAMASRGMSLPPAQQRTADGPVFRAASQQVAQQRAQSNPRAAQTMKSAAQSQTSAKAAQQAPAPAPRQAPGRSR